MCIYISIPRITCLAPYVDKLSISPKITVLQDLIEDISIEYLEIDHIQAVQISSTHVGRCIIMRSKQIKLSKCIIKDINIDLLEEKNNTSLYMNQLHIKESMRLSDILW
jgi:hypothetical protein